MRETNPSRTRSRWQLLRGRNLIHRIVREAPDIEIVITAERKRKPAG